MTALRVALVGAGHAHLRLLHRAAALRAAGVAPVLISPATFHYSGLATAVLSGALPPAAAQIDVAALAAARGVEHRVARVLRLDRAARQLHLDEGGPVAFDRVSLNIGSVPADPAGLASRPGVWTVKPLASLQGLRDAVEAVLTRERRCPEIVVAGTGASGLEVAPALAGLARRHGQPPRLTVIGPAPRGWAPAGALRALREGLQARGVTIRQDRVAGRQDGTCRLAGGDSLPCEMLVLAGGLRPPPLIAGLGLPLADDGRLLLTPSLQALGDPAVFAAGDCASFQGQERPALGVFGVRAAPVLARNLAAPAGSRLVAYHPQRRWLSILDLGDGTGLALRGGLWWQGRTALRLKRHLDLGFVRRMRGQG